MLGTEIKLLFLLLLQAFIIIRQGQTLPNGQFSIIPANMLKKLLDGAAVHLSFVCLFV